MCIRDSCTYRYNLCEYNSPQKGIFSFTQSQKNLKREIIRVFFIKFFKKPLCKLTNEGHMKWENLNQLTN